MREQIACISCGNKDVCRINPHPLTNGKPSGDVCAIELNKADQILSLMREEIEKALLTDEVLWEDLGGLPDSFLAMLQNVAQVQVQQILKALEEKE